MMIKVEPDIVSATSKLKSISKILQSCRGVDGDDEISALSIIGCISSLDADILFHTRLDLEVNLGRSK